MRLQCNPNQDARCCKMQHFRCKVNLTNDVSIFGHTRRHEVDRRLPAHPRKDGDDRSCLWSPRKAPRSAMQLSAACPSGDAQAARLPMRRSAVRHHPRIRNSSQTCPTGQTRESHHYFGNLTHVPPHPPLCLPGHQFGCARRPGRPRRQRPRWR